MINLLLAMEAFARVADCGGFARAGRALGVSAAVVTHRIAELERHLGTQLLKRTTRSVGLTPAGSAYLAAVRPILRAVADAEASVGEHAQALSGPLRVTAPVEFGARHLAPALVAFLRAHPALELHLDTSNRPVDLVEEGVDVAIRIGADPDGHLVARRLASTRLLFCASPAYLDRHGEPADPQDLAGHNVLAFSRDSAYREYRYPRADGSVASVRLRGNWLCNNAAALREAVLGGLGIAQLPSCDGDRELRDGRLRPLFANLPMPSLGVYAVCAHRGSLSARVRALIAHLAVGLGGDGEADPWWPGPPQG